jgi:hypothetical protein
MAEKRTTTRRKTGNSTTSKLSRNTAASLDLSGIHHGITYPEYDANAHIATDLFTDSSNTPRISNADAAEMLASIDEKKNALDVASANIELNANAVKTATTHAQFESELIQYATAQVQNAERLIHFQTAEISRDTAAIKRDTAAIKRDTTDIKRQVEEQKFEQEKLNLDGETNRTQQLIAKWERDKQLLDQGIQALDLQLQDGRRQLGLSARKLHVVDAKAI